MDKLLVLVGIIVLVGLIIWWFFGKRQVQSVMATRQGSKQIVEIIVDGGYTPNVVELQRDVLTEITFLRKDTSACFEEVVLPDFGIRTHLPVNKPFVVTLDPKMAGEYQYSCGMNMFFGKVVVK
jgi:plastocyanin domain-containing protein